MRESYTFQSIDGLKIQCYKWHDPKVVPLAAIQLVHGSVEHILRYDGFASFLAENGFVVFGNDHRGHGKSVNEAVPHSTFSEKGNGWNMTLGDMGTVYHHIQAAYEGLPVFVFGHSMGSFLARDYMARYGDRLAGAVLSGTTGGKGRLVWLVRNVAKLVSLVQKTQNPSPFIHQLIYGTLNDGVKDPRTPSDFISRDPVEVDKYIADPFCNVMISADYGYQMLSGTLKAYDQSRFDQVPKDLPIFIISGEEDPMAGKGGDDVLKVANQYEAAGVQSVTCKIYPGSRHELLNDFNKQQVYTDVLRWLKAQVPTTASLSIR